MKVAIQSSSLEAVATPAPALDQASANPKQFPIIWQEPQVCHIQKENTFLTNTTGIGGFSQPKAPINNFGSSNTGKLAAGGDMTICTY